MLRPNGRRRLARRRHRRRLGLGQVCQITGRKRFCCHNCQFFVIRFEFLLFPALQVAPLRAEGLFPVLQVAPLRAEGHVPVLRVAPLTAERQFPALRVAPLRAERLSPALQVAPLRAERPFPVLRVAPPGGGRESLWFDFVFIFSMD